MGNIKVLTNAKGQVIEEKTYGFLGISLVRTIKYSYDDLGRKTSIEVIEKDGKISSTKKRYDPSGYVETLNIDPDGTQSRSFQVYNSANEIILTVGELKGGHKYCNKIVHDREGNPVKFHSTYSREADIKTEFLKEFDDLIK